MADRMRVTSVILGSLPRGERRVSLYGGRRLARFGSLDLRSEAEFASALKSDTPTHLQNWPPALSSIDEQSNCRTSLASDGSDPRPVTAQALTGVTCSSAGRRITCVTRRYNRRPR